MSWGYWSLLYWVDKNWVGQYLDLDIPYRWEESGWDKEQEPWKRSSASRFKAILYGTLLFRRYVLRDTNMINKRIPQLMSFKLRNRYGSSQPLRAGSAVTCDLIEIYSLIVLESSLAPHSRSANSALKFYQVADMSYSLNDMESQGLRRRVGWEYRRACVWTWGMSFGMAM